MSATLNHLKEMPVARKKNTDDRVVITPAGLELLCTELWGEAWRAAFSEWTGITYSQLHRYMTIYNGQRIPKIVVLALVGLRDLRDLGKAGPDVSVFEADLSEAIPVKHIQKKKERPVRVSNDAPLIDIFGTGAPEAAPEPEPTPAPAPEPAKARPATTKARTGKAGPETGKAGPETGQGRAKSAAKAKKPAAAKAPAKARPRRAALAK